MTNSERREISNDQIFKTLRSAGDSLFKAGNKNSFDMSSGDPKDHFPRFFWESEVFFKEGHFFATPNARGIARHSKIKIGVLVFPPASEI